MLKDAYHPHPAVACLCERHWPGSGTRFNYNVTPGRVPAFATAMLALQADLIRYYLPVMGRDRIEVARLTLRELDRRLERD